MSYEDENRVVVPVHIRSSDVPFAAPAERPAPRRKRKGLSTRSFTLNANDPVQQILPLNLNRCEAWVQPLTNSVTLYSSKADAQSGGNAGITIPAAGSLAFPVNTTDPVWATAGTLPTTVSVWAIIEE